MNHNHHTQSRTARSKNPYMIHGIGDLFANFGLGLWMFMSLQVGSAVILGKLASKYLGMDRITVSASALLVALLINLLVYRLRKGHHRSAFLVPAVVLIFITVVPCLLLWFADHLRDLSQG